MQAGWRSALMEYGEQCVIVAGITMMLESCADNWGTVSTQVEVRYSSFHCEEDQAVATHMTK